MSLRAIFMIQSTGAYAQYHIDEHIKIVKSLINICNGYI